MFVKPPAPVGNPLQAIPMMKHIGQIILLIILFGCNHQSDKEITTSHKKVSIPNTNEEKLNIERSKIEIANSYYQFVFATDTTSFIKWGNDKFTNTSYQEIDNYLLDKDKIILDWATKEFIVLKHNSGSDTWQHIVLQLKPKQEPIFYENSLAFDRENGLVVYEFPSVKDTILIVENIITKRKKYLGKNWTKCSSALHHYCIDSISINNQELYLEWVTPNYIDKPNKKEIKKINLKN